jgi:hypothetical protein
VLYARIWRIRSFPGDMANADACWCLVTTLASIFGVHPRAGTVRTCSKPRATCRRQLRQFGVRRGGIDNSFLTAMLCLEVCARRFTHGYEQNQVCPTRFSKCSTYFIHHPPPAYTVLKLAAVCIVYWQQDSSVQLHAESDGRRIPVHVLTPACVRTPPCVQGHLQDRRTYRRPLARGQKLPGS